MPKILISYRRADSDAIAGRIRDRLAGFYGEESVFMDIDDIPFGSDFRKHIRDALMRNDALVVVVGPRWLGAAKGSHSRIKDETDPVRVEVEIALARNMPVIPLLVHGATMPRESDLPEGLKEFAYRNAAPIDTGRDFHQHMDRLIRSLDRIFEEKKKAENVSGAAAEPVAATPAPGSIDPPDENPPAEEQPAAPQPRRRGTAKPRRNAADPTNVPAIAGPPISAELPPDVSSKPLTPASDDRLEPLAANGRGAASGGDDATMPPIPDDGSAATTSTSAKTRIPEIRTSVVAALRRSHGLLLAAAVAAAMIVAIGVAYILTPGVTPVEPKEQAKEQTKEPTKERPPEKLQPAQIAALACKPDTAAVFRDDFKSPRPGWDWGPSLRGSKASYSDGELVLWAPEKGSIGVLYTPLVFRSGAVCAHVKSPNDDRTMATTGAGVIFWAQDSYNYYVAGVHPDGSYGIYRYTGMSASTVAARTRFDSVRRGLGIVNEIAIVLDDNHGTLFINNVKVQDFDGQPPSTGSAVGLWMQSQEDQANEWKFLDIAVVESR